MPYTDDISSIPFFEVHTIEEAGLSLFVVCSASFIQSQDFGLIYSSVEVEPPLLIAHSLSVTFFDKLV